MSLDHGLLNLPLSRRGDIDGQIDRYNRELRTPACHNREPWANSIRPDCTAWDIPATPTQFLPEIDNFDCAGCRWRPADEELAERLKRWNARER